LRRRAVPGNVVEARAVVIRGIGDDAERGAAAFWRLDDWQIAGGSELFANLSVDNPGNVQRQKSKIEDIFRNAVLFVDERGIDFGVNANLAFRPAPAFAIRVNIDIGVDGPLDASQRYPFAGDFMFDMIDTEAQACAVHNPPGIWPVDVLGGFNARWRKTTIAAVQGASIFCPAYFCANTWVVFELAIGYIDHLLAGILQRDAKKGGQQATVRGIGGDGRAKGRRGCL